MDDWKEVRSVKDLPTEEKVYWCRMPSGREVKLAWRSGNWVTWNTFHHPDTDPLTLVTAYRTYVPKTPQTPEQKREYHRQRRAEVRKRRDQERDKWIAAGRPKPRNLSGRALRTTSGG